MRHEFEPRTLVAPNVVDPDTAYTVMAKLEKRLLA
jgi:hypothetical protein